MHEYKPDHHSFGDSFWKSFSPPFLTPGGSPDGQKGVLGANKNKIGPGGLQFLFAGGPFKGFDYLGVNHQKGAKIFLPSPISLKLKWKNVAGIKKIAGPGVPKNTSEHLETPGGFFNLLTPGPFFFFGTKGGFSGGGQLSRRGGPFP